MTHDPRRALLASAQDLASRGWHLFPLIPGGKRPAVRAWEERSTTDPERIARCWASGAYNIGIATGPSRLVVIDLDTPKAPDDIAPEPWNLPGIVEGADVLAAVCERYGQPYPADTFTIRTGRGGAHLYFAAPTGDRLRNTASRLGWKVDTRAAGGYVVAPGSIVNGRHYAAVHDTAPAPLPGWLAELLRPTPLPPQRPVVVALATDRRGAYLNAAVTGEVDRVRKSGPHRHNTALYRAAVALGQLVASGELDEADVTGQLAAAALSVGQSEREARRTIASGLRAGAQRPRTVAA
jgi:hypothetical protein